MQNEVIVIKDLWKEFKTFKREPGLMSAVSSIFKRKYVTHQALKGVSLNIKKGEIVGLIGPNGAGKSTLIKILSGVLYPSKGEVKVMEFTPWTDRIEYSNHLGVVFGQKSQLWWDLPAIDSFEMNKGIYEIPEKKYRKRLNLMIKLLGVKDFIRKPVRQLSLGERMRCEVILALLHNPKIVFLDEPSIGLDIIAKEKMREFIKTVNKEYGTTFIITTHDMGDIEKLCKRIIIINHGLILYDGSIENVREKFANRKIIDCTFSEPMAIKRFKYKGTSILSRSNYQLILELDLKKAKIKGLIDYLLKKYGEWDDIDIKDPPIEEIIAIIYRK
jgi:ABC-2 type transport system ATP-binding protein